MTRQRLQQIKQNWIGDNGQGLAVRGNESYRQIAELVDAVEEQDRTVYTLRLREILFIVAVLFTAGVATGVIGSVILK